MAALPSTFAVSTSAEAFKYPLPSVRQFQKQLSVALDEKNVRLRTLVGGSYRQLLGTAEMIVEMRRNIGIAEAKMGHVAEACGRSAVSKRVASLGKLQGSGIQIAGKTGTADLSWVARMRVLGGCAMVVGRLLRGKDVTGLLENQTRGSKLITAAKVLVLSRLLVKNLGDDIKNGNVSIADAEGLLDELRVKLGSLRRRLLRSIEKTLEEVDGDQDDLVQALAAYSLATSSGAKDVMRHFLHVRGESMAMCFEEDEELSKGNREHEILRGLSLYTRTLLDVQAIVPRRLSECLLGLKGNPLLKDSTIRNLEGLRLDVSEKCFGDEIMFFTPYIRHDDLGGLQAVDTLKGWAKKASQVLLKGLEKSLGLIGDFKAVGDLRTKILESWILEGGKAKGFDPSIMLNELRNVINQRLESLVEARVMKLHLVGTEIGATLGTWMSNSMGNPPNPWGYELLHMNLSRGAIQFKKAILSEVHGRDNAVSRAINGYETWKHLIDELTTIIEQFKSQRWEDDLESLEDDDSLEKRSKLLSKDDPEVLQTHLEDHLRQSFQDLHQQIAGQLLAQRENENIGAMARYLLRFLRDIRGQLPKSPNLTSFGLSLVPELHSILVSNVSSTPLEEFTNSTSRSQKVAGRALWEGEPELPIHPSPMTFKFFHSLSSSMLSAGSDLWSATAVEALKRHLSTQIGSQWLELLELSAIDATKSNSHKGEDENEAKVENNESQPETEISEAEDSVPVAALNQRDKLVQSLFDVYVLKCGLSVPPSPSVPVSASNELDTLEKTLIVRAEVAVEQSKALQLAAEEYWKKIGLLFGILG